LPLLRRLGCAMGEVCTPILKVDDPLQCFSTCMAGGVVAGREERFRWGACVPAEVATSIGLERGELESGTCHGGDVCVPCLNPLGATGEEPTGVCD
jgi:hypothetical protein